MNCKQIFIVLALTAGVFLHGAEFQIEVKGWEKNRDGILNVAKGKKRSLSFQAEKGKHYLIRFEAFGTAGGSGSCKVVLGGRKTRFPFRFHDKWSECLHYLYAPESGSVNMVFPSASGEFQLRNFSVTELSEADLKGELLKDGDAESEFCFGGDFLAFNKKGPKTTVTVVDNPGHFAGNRTFLYKIAQIENGQQGFVSRDLPLIPGKCYQLSFWAKSHAPIWLESGLSLSAPFGHKGKYFSKKERCKIGTEWSFQKFTFEIPTDTALYPDLEAHMGRVIINLTRAPQAGELWIDDLSLKQIDPQKDRSADTNSDASGK